MTNPSKPRQQNKVKQIPTDPDQKILMFRIFLKTERSPIGISYDLVAVEIAKGIQQAHMWTLNT